MDIIERLEKTEVLLKNNPRLKSEIVNKLENWKFNNLVKSVDIEKQKFWSISSCGYMLIEKGKLVSYTF